MIKDHISESEYRSLQNKIRKAWVSIVDKEIFNGLDRDQKFKKYKELDYNILKRYQHLVKGRKNTELKSKDLDNIMIEASRDVLGELK